LGRAFFTGEFDGALVARPVFTTWQRCALLAAFALLLIMRLPAAWAHGRFQAEEGTVFLAYAWHFPWTEALFRSFAGYLNLGANAPAVLTVELVRSGILPLERAPYLTMGIALAFQLLPAVLILTGKAQWLQSRLATIAALLIIALAPASEEVFYNTLHIQFHLALCVALILALDVPAKWPSRIFNGTLLFLAPLCGPAAIVILPLFALRALIDRDRGRVGQFAMLAFGAAVQLMFFYGAAPFRHAPDVRTMSAALFVRLVLLPLTGLELTNWAARDIWASQSLMWAAAGASIVVFSILAATAARRRDGTIWLVLAGLGVAAVSIRFGIFSADARNMLDVAIGERYNYLPMVLLGLSLIAAATQSGSARLVWVLLVLLVLFNSALDYRKVAYQWIDGPDWAAEVRVWRANRNYQLATWPRQWTVDLSDRTHPCSRPDIPQAQPAEPRYCEGGWLARYLDPDPNRSLGGAHAYRRGHSAEPMDAGKQ
jgi:hypothetical protein